MTATKASPLQQVLTLLTGTTAPAPAAWTPARPEPVLELNDELSVFVLHLEHVLTLLIAVGLPGPPLAITRLSKVHDQAVALQFLPFGTAGLVPGDEDRQASRVHAAAWTLQIAAPQLVCAARFSSSVRSQGFGGADTQLAAAAAEIMTTYADAVSNAWATGRFSAGTLQAAGASLQAFPAFVRQRYLEHGLDVAIVGLISLRDRLIALTGPTAPTMPAAYGDVIIDAAPGGVWRPGKDLQTELDNVRFAFPGITPAAQKAAISSYESLLRQVQAFHLTMTALIAHRQLAMIIDAAFVNTSTINRLKDNKTTLEAALDQVHAGFTTGNAQFVAGSTAIANLVGSAQFKADFDEGVDQVAMAQMVKTIVLSAAILAAAAYTGGLAAAGAEAAIGAFEGSVLVGEVSLEASLGGFAAEVMTFTLVDRFGKQLLFGPGSTAGATFAEDLFWNAITMGTLKMLTVGYGALFKELGAKSFRFRIGKFAVDQITLFAIGQVQHATQTKQTAAMPDDGRQIVSQLAIAVLMELGGDLRTSVAERIGASAAALQAVKDANAANLAAAEAGAISLGEKLDLIKEMHPADVNTADLAVSVQQQYNMVVDLVTSIPEGTEGKELVLNSLAASKVMIELRFAQTGGETSLAGKDAPSTVGPGGTNVVVYNALAEALLDQALQSGGAAPMTDAVGIEDAKVSATSNGDLTVLVSAQKLGPPPSTAKELELAALVTELLPFDDDGQPFTLADVSETAAKGLANLNAPRATNSGQPWANDTILAILAKAKPEAQISFLRFMSLPEFASTAAEVGQKDLMAFAESQMAREFASQWGVRLAVQIRSQIVQHGGTKNTVLAAYQRSATELAAAVSPAAKAQLLTEISARTVEQWQQLVAPKPVVIPLPPPVADGTFGVVQGSPSWLKILAEETALNPGADPALLKQYADIEQIMERARGGDYHQGGTMNEAEFRDLLLGFLGKCRAAGMIQSHINGKLGALAEYLFLPGATKVTFKLGKPASPKDTGASRMDDFQATGGDKDASGKPRPLGREGKANLLHEMVRVDPVTHQTAVDLERTGAMARQHMIDIAGGTVGGKFKTGDVVNMPKGTQHVIWYFFESLADPTDAQYERIIYEHSAPGSKTEKVKVGSRPWRTITARAQ